LELSWPGRLHFTVAIFERNTGTNEPVDIGGGDICDALDVITKTSGNTWNEVSDNIINFYLDFKFDADGDVTIPEDWRKFESWQGTVRTVVAWRTVESWSGSVRAVVLWDVVESWTGTVDSTTAIWRTVERWTARVSSVTAIWICLETWEGSVEGFYAWIQTDWEGGPTYPSYETGSWDMDYDNFYENENVDWSQMGKMRCENVAGVQWYYAENVAGGSTSSSLFEDAVTLSFNATLDNYLIIATATVGEAESTGGYMSVRLVSGATIYAEENFDPEEDG
jgi:hypothetical protein